MRMLGHHNLAYYTMVIYSFNNNTLLFWFSTVKTVRIYKTFQNGKSEVGYNEFKLEFHFCLTLHGSPE